MDFLVDPEPRGNPALDTVPRFFEIIRKMFGSEFRLDRNHTAIVDEHSGIKGKVAAIWHCQAVHIRLLTQGPHRDDDVIDAVLPPPVIMDTKPASDLFRAYAAWIKPRRYLVALSSPLLALVVPH